MVEVDLGPLLPYFRACWARRLARAGAHIGPLGSALLPYFGHL